MESNHLEPPYQSGAQPESLSSIEPDVRVELTFRVYRTGASPLMIVRQNLEPSPGIKPELLPYQRRALSLSYDGWSQNW